MIPRLALLLLHPGLDELEILPRLPSSQAPRGAPLPDVPAMHHDDGPPLPLRRQLRRGRQSRQLCAISLLGSPGDDDHVGNGRVYSVHAVEGEKESANVMCVRVSLPP